MQVDTPTAVIYLRVSTKEQATRGSDTEGFSIPAQRDACERKAHALAATVTKEFVDAGESAKSADRHQLQKMLEYLTQHPTTYVIVHKIDRLARNRADDVQINLAIQAAGSILVSVTENIDATPSGILLHGIMSSIAEFYSRNLAHEVSKGSRQKAMNGGTPTIAPIGYLNVRETVDGSEVRTIRVDSERAPHIVWAFQQYATGEWSLPKLAAALEARGLTQRPTPKRPARALPMNKLHKVLRNRYYIGQVTWEGIEYPGRHEPLVDPAVFDQVQHVLGAHRQSGERSYRRRHYLAGSLYCARCGAKLIYAISTGKLGTRYAYWLCGGRHNRKNGCGRSYIAASRIEDAVIELWHRTQLPLNTIEQIRAGLSDDLLTFTSHANNELRNLRQRIRDIKRERLKWAELAMDGTVPRDIARDKQQVLASTLGQLEHQQGSLQATSVDQNAAYDAVLDILGKCAEAYERVPDALRRDFNQACFERILVDETDGEPLINRADRTDVIEILTTATVTPKGHPDGQGVLPMTTHSTVKGSMIVSLVELRGIEPVTFSMRTRRPWLWRRRPCWSRRELAVRRVGNVRSARGKIPSRLRSEVSGSRTHHRGRQSLLRRRHKRHPQNVRLKPGRPRSQILFEQRHHLSVHTGPGLAQHIGDDGFQLDVGVVAQCGRGDLQLQQGAVAVEAR
ncbi:recombinase family protein [Mycobacterium sp. BK086]|uniref:recombinase family protein n=1 Tax=Mycobacterium sp. BK086 TaxID=2512165 RepID=UPI001414CEC4|nr:recombinase family protein [Mycobacterium sp. BK086]